MDVLIGQILTCVSFEGPIICRRIRAEQNLKRWREMTEAVIFHRAKAIVMLNNMGFKTKMHTYAVFHGYILAADYNLKLKL